MSVAAAAGRAGNAAHAPYYGPGRFAPDDAPPPSNWRSLRQHRPEQHGQR